MSSPARAQPPASALAEINVTPLIDVMLVLLVVFMISLPAARTAIGLDLPQPRPGPVELAPVAPVVLSIDVQGRLAWDGRAMELAQVDWRLRQAGRQEPAPTLIVEPAAGAPYARVARVLALARNAGVQRIGFRH